MSINLLRSRLKPDSHKTNLLILVGIALAIIPPLVSLALQGLPKADPPTGSYLNPLPRGQQASENPKPLPFYLGTAQTSLDTAREMANSNPHQSPQDKQQIINLINQAMAAANQAINFYPKDPRAYQQRAAILFSVAHLNSSTKALAEHDLKTAQSLAQDKSRTLNPPQSDFETVENTNPLDTLPLEQATLAQNLIIAVPREASGEVGPNFSDISSNVTKATVILPANQTELKIGNWKLEIDSVIYLIPQASTRNHTVYVKSKSSGQMIISIDKPLSYDLTIDYWIINQ